MLKLGQSDLENEGGEENVLTFKTILLSCLVQYSTFCLDEALIIRLPWVAAKSRQCLAAFLLPSLSSSIIQYILHSVKVSFMAFSMD